MDRLGGQIEAELRRFGRAGSALGESMPGEPMPGGEMVAIVRAWPAVVGEENARRAWPARLARDGVLVVHASDSVWAFQLGMLAGSIHERLVAELGGVAPAGLKFVPGPIPSPAAAPVGERAPKPPRVGPEDTAQGREIASSIEDVELREIVARAAAASLAKGRSDRAF